MPQSQRLYVRDIASRAKFDQASPVRKAQVRAAHIRIFYELTQLAVAVSLAVVGLLVWILGARVPLGALLPWASAVAVVALVRYFFARRFIWLNPDDAAIARWGHGAWMASLVQGVLWGLLPFIVVEGGSNADLLLTVFMLCAFGFGAFATLGFYLPAYLGFAIPILALLFVWFVREVPHLSLPMAALVIIACTVMSVAGVRATRVLRGALLLAVERAAWLRETTEDKERIQVTLQAIGDGVISTDVSGRVTYLNATAQQLTGWGADAEGRPLSEVLHFAGGTSPDLVGLCLTRDELVTLEGDRRLLTRDGAREFAVRVKASPIRDFEQRVIGVVIVLHDVTELAGLAQTLQYQSAHDQLTGLLNRRAFEEALADVIAQSRPGSGHCLCYLDLDQFKLVNDTCGHAAGDQLLQQLAERFRRRVRESDVMARLGGDEFGVLLVRCGLDRAKQIADELTALVQEFRFAWEDRVFNIGVSVGLVPFDGSADAAEIMAAADAACYLAKDEGRNRTHVAQPGDLELASRHGEMHLTSHIQRALDADRFRLRFQRMAPLSQASAPAKGEFLLSMLSEDGRLLSPGEFLPAAERFNMMPKLDRHVVRLALRMIMENRPELAGIETFAINLSGQTLTDEAFLPFVIEQIVASRVNPRQLCFEITETAVISHLGRALALIRRLRTMGCRFALDDFGAGLSSFGYLRSLPVDYLKIDGQFVRNISSDPVNRSIVEAVHRVGAIMGLKTIAESVEDEATAAALRTIGVDFGQGWHFQRPVLLQPRSSPSTT